MADPISTENPSVGAKVADAAETGAKWVGNAAKAVAKSVADDGKNLVGKDIAVGTRVEAGLNLAADVSSFVVGPEDAAAERAAVFAVKEGVEHAPQIAEGAEVAAKAVIEKAPAIEKAAVSGFERTETLLKSAGHKLEDLRPSEGILETKNALYKVVEKGAHDVNGVRAEVGDAGREAYDKGKNFAVHAEGVGKDVIDGIKKIGQETYHAKEKLSATISTSEMQIEKSIGVAEHHSIAQRAEKLLDKGKDVFKNVSEPIEDGKKIVEAVKKGIEFAGEHKGLTATVGGAVASGVVHEAQDIKELAKSTGQHIVEGAKSVGHVAAEAEHGVAHAASETGQHVASAAKALVDDVKKWTPEMPFEQFGALINKVRGVSPTPPSVAHDLGHSQSVATKTPQKTPDIGHGH